MQQYDEYGKEVQSMDPRKPKVGDQFYYSCKARLELRVVLEVSEDPDVCVQVLDAGVIAGAVLQRAEYYKVILAGGKTLSLAQLTEQLIAEDTLTSEPALKDTISISIGDPKNPTGFAVGALVKFQGQQCTNRRKSG